MSLAMRHALGLCDGCASCCGCSERALREGLHVIGYIVDMF